MKKPRRNRQLKIRRKLLGRRWARRPLKRQPASRPDPCQIDQRAVRRYRLQQRIKKAGTQRLRLL
jgi:hypothetical protein